MLISLQAVKSLLEVVESGGRNIELATMRVRACFQNLRSCHFSCLYPCISMHDLSPPPCLSFFSFLFNPLMSNLLAAHLLPVLSLFKYFDPSSFYARVAFCTHNTQEGLHTDSLHTASRFAHACLCTASSCISSPHARLRNYSLGIPTRHAHARLCTIFPAQNLHCKTAR